VFLFLGTKSERIRSSLKHFTVGPAGELGANSSKNIFRHLAGAEVLQLWPVQLLGSERRREYRHQKGASCGGSGVFEAVARALFMVEVDADGNVFGVDTQGNLVQIVGVTISNPPGSSWTNIGICLNGHKHVTFDLGRLYVICSDGSIRR
uniref:Uncharacterized protein n=1 Tax=Cyprinus carpio TaxID=7962 RepID=A0A8C2GT19_CYPCA